MKAGKSFLERAMTIDLSRIPVNKGINSRLGWTKYSDFYEIVHPSLVLISFYPPLLTVGQSRVLNL